MPNMIYIPKWFNILLSCDNNSISKIRKLADSSCYSYVYDIIELFIELGWVTSSKTGREREISVTPEGNKIKDILRELKFITEGKLRDRVQIDQ